MPIKVQPTKTPSAMNKTYIEELLTSKIEWAEEVAEDHDAANWNYQEGVLISVNQAKAILNLLSAPSPSIEEREVSAEWVHSLKKSPSQSGEYFVRHDETKEKEVAYYHKGIGWHTDSTEIVGHLEWLNETPSPKEALTDKQIEELAIDAIPIYPIRADSTLWKERIENARKYFIAGYKSALSPKEPDATKMSNEQQPENKTTEVSYEKRHR